MTNKSGFPIAAAIAAAIAVAMLIFLFTVPGNYLRDMTAKLRVMTHEAEQAAVLGDMATAAERLDAITREYNSRRDKIKMFFIMTTWTRWKKRSSPAGILWPWARATTLYAR